MVVRASLFQSKQTRPVDVAHPKIHLNLLLLNNVENSCVFYKVDCVSMSVCLSVSVEMWKREPVFLVRGVITLLWWHDVTT